MLNAKRSTTLEALERRFDELPMLPTVVARLMSIDPESDNFFDDVVKVAQEDPSLAIRLLKCSNSIASSPRSPITSVRSAVVRMGARKIAGLVTSMAVMKVFVPTTPGQRTLWVHAVEVAVGARIIAQRFAPPWINAEEAYMCGLLHDIGRFVMFEFIPSELSRVEDTAWMTGADLIEAELEICGFDHSELGWHACEKWSLPKTLTELTEHHHDYRPINAYSLKEQGVAGLLPIVQLADSISFLTLKHTDYTSWSKDQFEEKLNRFCNPPTWTLARPKPDALIQAIHDIKKESAKILQGLGIRMK